MPDPIPIYLCPTCGGPAYLFDDGSMGPAEPPIEPCWIYRCPIHEVWGTRVEVVPQTGEWPVAAEQGDQDA